jgi:hypothetical protein
MGPSVRIFGKHLVHHTPCGLLILLLRLHYGFLLAIKMHNRRCRHHFRRVQYLGGITDQYDLPVF